MKLIKKTMLAIVAVLLLGLLGCSAMLDAITPCYINPDHIKYADVSPTTLVPFTTLWDSQRISGMIDYRFLMMEIEHGFIKKTMWLHQAAAQELQTKVMQPALMGIIGSGTFAFGWLGLSKPKDRKKIEAAKNDNKNT